MSHPMTSAPSTTTAAPVTVSCMDAVGRTRQLTVTPGAGGQVTLRTPPGEAAVLHRMAAARLADLLHAFTSTPATEHPGEQETTP
jgi:hypothetical protein